MTNTSLIERIRVLAEPLAESLNLVVWGVEFSGGARSILRVYVDALPDAEGTSDMPNEEVLSAGGEDPLASEQGAVLPHGVSIDQCGELSRLLGASLEVEDIMSNAYILEVSSPGLERPFFNVSQLHPYIGSPVELVLFASNPTFPGRKNFKGVLVDAPCKGMGGPVAIVPDHMSLPVPENVGRLVFDWSEVKRMRLVHIFPEPRKPGKR